MVIGIMLMVIGIFVMVIDVLEMVTTPPLHIQRNIIKIPGASFSKRSHIYARQYQQE